MSKIEYLIVYTKQQDGKVTGLFPETEDTKKLMTKFGVDKTHWTEALLTLGAEGWELIESFYNPIHYTPRMILKRFATKEQDV